MYASLLSSQVVFKPLTAVSRMELIMKLKLNGLLLAQVLSQNFLKILHS